MLTFSCSSWITIDSESATAGFVEFIGEFSPGYCGVGVVSIVRDRRCCKPRFSLSSSRFLWCNSDSRFLVIWTFVASFSKWHIALRWIQFLHGVSPVHLILCWRHREQLSNACLSDGDWNGEDLCPIRYLRVYHPSVCLSWRTHTILLISQCRCETV